MPTTPHLHRSTDGMLCTDLESELVLIEPDSGQTFRLNRAARTLWLALPATRESLATTLRETFDLCETAAAADADRALRDLRAAGLLQPGGD